MPKSMRLRGYDYTQTGQYFITICTYQRWHYFGEIEAGKMILNRLGEIASELWRTIPQHFIYTELGEMVVMPNHVHGILHLTHNADTHYQAERFQQPIKGSISTIVRSYKSAVTKHINQLPIDTFVVVSPEGERLLPPLQIWQQGYHDHVIRDATSYGKIQTYIRENPANWAEDVFAKPNRPK